MKRLYIVFLCFSALFLKSFASSDEKIAQLTDSVKKYWRIDNSKAREFAKKTLEMVDTNNVEQYAECLKNLGVTYYFSFITDSAEIFYTRSLLYFTKAASLQGQNKVLNNLGVLKMEEGKYEKAIEYYDKSYKIAIAMPDTAAIIRSLSNISNVYSEIKNFKKSLAFNLKALQYAGSFDDKLTLAHVYANLLSDYKENHDFVNFEKYSKLALSQYLELDDSLGIATVYTNMANGYENFNQVEKAVELNKIALAIFEKMNNPWRAVHVQLSLGNNYRNLQDYDLSTKYYEEGLKRAESMQMRNNLKEFYRNLYINAYIFKDNNKARIFQMKADSMETILVSEGLQEKMADMETKYKTLEKENEIQRLMVEKEKQQKRLQLIVFIAFLILGSGAVLVFFYRSKQQRKQAKLNQTKAEIENRLLRVQMNPHFMFNSLNSLQSYITSNQNQLAEEYLARFALLTRQILNNSREEFVLFADELKTIKTYLELEQQRFDNAFSFSLLVDDNIDDDFSFVPPMLIQPFVENAIIHGVAPLKKNGNIDLRFQLDSNNNIQCSVEDNGVGREASALINKGSKHHSLGMQVTRERLQLIEEQTGVPLAITFVDRKDEQGKACGTLVCITLPVKIK